jgi:hypothetical protein
MVRSSHPNIVAKVCGDTPWMNVAWTRLGGGHYINEDDFTPVLIYWHLTDL